MENTSSKGPLIGSIIVIVIIILGGLFFWGKQIDKKKVDTQIATEQELQNLQTQETSDDITSIQTDLNTTNFDSIDSSLGEI